MTLFPGSIYGGLAQLGASAKAAGVAAWWNVGTCKLAYQAKGAASAAAALVNLASPGTNDAYAGDAPGWAAVTGWDFNGSSNYLLCGSISIDHNDMTILVRCDVADASRRTLFTTTTNNTPNYPWLEVNANAAPGKISSVQPGVYRRISITGISDNGDRVIGASTNLWTTPDVLYYDGAVVTNVETLAGTPTTLVTGSNAMAIGVRAVPSSQLFKGLIAAVAVYSPRLSNTQVLTVSQAMAAL